MNVSIIVGRQSKCFYKFVGFFFINISEQFSNKIFILCWIFNLENSMWRSTSSNSFQLTPRFTSSPIFPQGSPESYPSLLYRLYEFTNRKIVFTMKISLVSIGNHWCINFSRFCKKNSIDVFRFVTEQLMRELSIALL